MESRPRLFVGKLLDRICGWNLFHLIKKTLTATHTHTHRFGIQGDTQSSPWRPTLSPWRRLKLTLPNLYHNNRRSRGALKHAAGEMKTIPRTELTDPPLCRGAVVGGRRGNLGESWSRTNDNYRPSLADWCKAVKRASLWKIVVFVDRLNRLAFPMQRRR